MKKLLSRQTILVVTAVIIIFSAFRIINSNYHIGDAYWTPLRSLYESTIEDTSVAGQIYKFIHLTVHNDSVKLFPSLVEYFFFRIQGIWKPRISLTIVFISWLLCYFLFLYLILSLSIYKKKYSPLIALVLALIFFSSVEFYSRFTTVFAIHRTLPVICVLISCWAVFKTNSWFFIKYLQAPVLILCGVVSQFSFANGGFLWIIMIAACIYNMKESSNKIRLYTTKSIILSGLVSTFVYFTFFNSTHANALIKDNSIQINVFSSILYTLDYSTGFINISLHKPIEWIVKISLLITYGIILIKFLSRRNLVAIPSQTKRSFENFFYIASFFVTIPLLNAIARGHTLVPNRYYVELTMFSLSVYIIFCLIASHCNFFRLRHCLFVLLLLSSISNLYYLGSQVGGLMLQEIQPYGDVEVVQCIRDAEQTSYFILYNRCKLNKNFWHFEKGRETEHSFIKITDPKHYSTMVFKVIGGK